MWKQQCSDKIQLGGGKLLVPYAAEKIDLPFGELWFHFDQNVTFISKELFVNKCRALFL